jgi:excisionase family DNA binding protein
VPIAEACRVLSISRATASRRIADGSIKAVHIGPTIRVPVAELRRLVGDDRRPRRVGLRRDVPTTERGRLSLEQQEWRDLLVGAAA